MTSPQVAQEPLVGFGRLDTPEEITKLGCAADIYRGEVAWLEKLHAEVIHWQSTYSHVYGSSCYPYEKRQLTGVEFKRVLADIKKLGLIVATDNPCHMNGVGYWLYTNPFRDLLASGVHKGQVGKPRFIFLLHFQCLGAECIEGLTENNRGEEAITKIYRFIHPISHTKTNLAWCQYYQFPAVELSYCFY